MFEGSKTSEHPKLIKSPDRNDTEMSATQDPTTATAGDICPETANNSFQSVNAGEGIVQQPITFQILFYSVG